MNRRRARRRTASIPNWAVDGSGQVLAPGITYTADVDGEVMAFQATDQGLSVLTGMQPGLVSWEELEGAWDSFKPQKVSTRTSSFEIGDRVLYMGDAVVPGGIPGTIEGIDGDTYNVQYDEEAGGGFANAFEDELQTRTSRRRQISSFKIGDEVYINAPISAYSDVDDQYGTIVSGDENEFQVKTEDGEIVDITPEYLEMHIESKRKASRRISLGRARIRSRRQAQRRQSALTWSEVPGLPGSWEADENGIYFSYSAPYKELDWWDGTTDFYYDGNPSLEEAKQIAERVISGEETGSTL